MFTVREICELIGIEVPQTLEEKSEQEISGVDARYTQVKTTDVYFDIDGEEDSLKKAIEAGCLFIVSSRAQVEDIENASMPVVNIPDAMQAYVNVCRKIAMEFPNITRVAVTGSSGKTSMKEMIAFLLSQAVSTGKSYANSNNLVGLAKQMGAFRSNNRFYIQEIGLKSDGKGEYTIKMAEAFCPSISVITNINDNHKEAYLSRENIFKHKKAILDELTEDGIALLNKDDEILAAYKPKQKTLYYSLYNEKADVYAANVRIVGATRVFDVNINGYWIKDITLNSLVEANIYNALVAITVAKLNGLDDELIVRAMKRYKTNFATRENLVNIAGFNLYIDCFNSSPESIRYDVDFLSKFNLPAEAKRIAVLGDIAELGEESESLHASAGESIKDYKFDMLFCFGEKSRFIYEAVRANERIQCFHTENRAELERTLAANMKPGDLIVWKASHSMHLELTIDNMFGTNFYSLYPMDESETKINTTALFEYTSCANGVLLKKYFQNAQDVALPTNINGAKVRAIGTQMFLRKNVVKIKFPTQLKHIGDSAFFRCQNLSDMTFPDSLQFIQKNAFNRCSALTELKIPKNCLHIGEQAFQFCRRLKSVYIPNEKTYIGTNAFEGCPDLVIYCKENSFAHHYAEKNGIKYSLVGEVLKPVTKFKDITIKSISLEERGDMIRLNTHITVGDNEPDVLWWEFDRKWRPYVCDDRSDAMIVILLLYGMRAGYDRIVSELPVSKKLWYQLTFHLIPQICKVEQEKYPRIQIVAPLTDEVYEKKKVTNATGFSRGVDSFATLYEYGHTGYCPEDYKISLLTVYNVGAFHGKDVGLRSSHSSQQLFEGHLKESEAFAKKHNYNIMSVNSNLPFFLDDNFGHYPFQNSATEHNLGTTLLFQKMVDRFYYSSGHTMEEFKLSLTESSARWEQYAVQFFNTENTSFFIANQDWDRMEKIERIAHMPEAHDDLQVCLVDIGNCGVCTKCRRTLMNLDVLGDDVLEKFRGSFDIDTYREQHRAAWFSTIYKDKEEDQYLYQVFKYGVEHGSSLIPEPKVTALATHMVATPKVKGIIVRELPTNISREIALLQDFNFNAKVIALIGSTWVQVMLEDGKLGYVPQNMLNITKKATGVAAKKAAVKKVVTKTAEKDGALKAFAKRVLPPSVKNWIKKHILHR